MEFKDHLDRQHSFLSEFHIPKINKIAILKQILISALFILSLAGVNCKTQCDCYKNKSAAVFENGTIEPWKTNQFSIDSLRTIIKAQGINPVFGWHMNIAGGDTSLCFLTESKTLISFDLERNRIKSEISLAGLNQLNGTFVINIQSDTLLLIKQSNNIYYKYIIDAKKSPRLIDTFNIGIAAEFENSLVSFAIGRQSTYYKHPFLYFKYGIHSEQNNFIDRTAYFELNTLDKSMRKIFEYPDCYHCSRVYLPTSSMAIINDWQPVVLFDSYDALFFFDKNGDLKNRQPIVHRYPDSCRMQKFDLSQKGNLAYIRKHLTKNEVNTALITTKSNQLIAIQRKGKNTLHEKSIFNMYVFDSTGNQVYNAPFPFGLSTVLTYKSGIIALNDSLNKAYYYGF